MRIFVIEVCRVLVVELTPFSSLNFHSLHLGALTGGILFFGDFNRQLLILEILFHRNLLGLREVKKIILIFCNSATFLNQFGKYYFFSLEVMYNHSFINHFFPLTCKFKGYFNFDLLKALTPVCFPLSLLWCT